MIGFVIRLLACLILAVATVFAIGDIARSLSVDAVRLTSVGEAMALAGSWGSGAVAANPGADAFAAMIADWPVSPTLAVLAFILLLLGRRRPTLAGFR